MSHALFTPKLINFHALSYIVVHSYSQTLLLCPVYLQCRSMQMIMGKNNNNDNNNDDYNDDDDDDDDSNDNNNNPDVHDIC